MKTLEKVRLLLNASFTAEQIVPVLALEIDKINEIINIYQDINKNKGIINLGISEPKIIYTKYVDAVVCTCRRKKDRRKQNRRVSLKQCIAEFRGEHCKRNYNRRKGT